MKIIFLAILVVLSFNLSSQCLNLNELILFFNKDVEKQDDFLSKMNYTIFSDDFVLKLSECEGEFVCTEFENTITKSFIKLVHTKSNYKTIKVEYRMKSDKYCYDLIREGLSSNNFKKEYEMIFENSFNYFYSNNKMGIMLSKWKHQNLPDYFYQIRLMQIDKYKDELLLQKSNR